MTLKINKNIPNKTLSVKKSRLLRSNFKYMTPTYAKVSAHPSFKFPNIRYSGRRKIKKLKVIKSGSTFYNTSVLNDGEKPWHSWKAGNLTLLRNKLKFIGNKARKNEALVGTLNQTSNTFGASGRTETSTENLVSLKNNIPLLNILQNKLMHDGRKGAAEKIVLNIIKELNRYNKSGAGHRLLYAAIETLKPTLITMVRRVGRNYYHVPVPLHGPRQYKFAFQWLLEIAEKNPRIPIHKSVVEEVIAVVSSSSSEALKKKELMYRSVITNRAYSHYRWI
jgi:ribosomal protein S7